ncbi:MAG: PAS domain S-box protein [Candidatus Stygibacter australis]|nr:PAS domain S-box protein [Candidatus Stygibacter australis]
MTDKLQFQQNYGIDHEWLIKHSINMFYIHTADHQIVYLSPQVEKMLGYTQEEALVIWTELVTDNPINEIGFENTMKAIRTGETQPVYELELITKVGKKIRVEVNETPILEDGVVKYISGSLTEITERRKSEIKQQVLYNISSAINQADDLDELFKRIRWLLSEVVNVKNFYIALIDEQTKKIAFPYFVSELEQKPQPMEYFDSKGITQYVIETGKAKLVNQNELKNMESKGIIKLTGKLPKLWLGVPLKIDNSVIGVISVQCYHDEHCYSEEDMELLNFVSEEVALAIKHKQAEQKIVGSLREKESLLRELYHRTKNNMQIIEAMLIMSAEFSENEDIIKLNQEIADKIYSMSLVHQKLYEEKDLSSIDLQDYIKEFSEHMMNIYTKENNYRIELDLVSVKVSIDSAVPLGLVLAELITNAFKHAFIGMKDGIIKIKLDRDENNLVVLEISDNGVGIDPDKDLLALNSMGIRTAYAIVEFQLQGELTYESDGGLKWKISYSDEHSGTRINVQERSEVIPSTHESEEKFRIISETSPMAIMIYQNDKWVYANKAASLISGYSNQELMQMRFWDFVHPDYQEKVKSIGIRRQKSLDTINSYEFKIITKSGNEKWVWLSGTSTTYNDKQAGIITVQDITARKNAERKLKESEERFKFLTKATFEGIVVHKKGTIIDANDSFLKISGYSREECIGKYLLDYIPKMKDKAKIIYNIAKKQEVKPYLVTAIRKDGSPFIAELESKNVKNTGENIRIAAVRDVTERQKAQEQLKIAHERLRIMNSILRHDIANDLAVIDSALELYLDKPQDHLLTEMRRVVNRCINTIRNQQKQTVNLENVKFQEKIDLKMVIDEITVNHPEIKIIISGDQKKNVQADEAMYSVFDNLISNAVIHGKADEIKIEISEEDEFCQITFTDNGVGIPLEVMPKIFEKGYHYGKTGHTGIGLYIVQKTIEEFEGNISVKSNQPQGTIFVINLRKV